MILLRIAKYSVIFFILSSFAICAQQNLLIVPDSSQSITKEKYRFRLSNKTNIYSPLFSMKQQIADFNNFQFYFPNIESPSHSPNVSMLNLRNEINQTMNIYRQGQNKYHLGVVSDILGYASGAAALGLAAYHVSKYKKYYGIK